MKKKCIFCFTIIILFFILIENKTFASSQSMNSLNYNVQILENGDMIITESWNITIEDTNTLFKTFELDSSKYAGITDVSVTETSNSTNVDFVQINEYMYHVTENSFYALEISDDEFEVAWGVNVTSTATKNYILQYTIKDAITQYADCYELYWQFLSNENSISCKNVTGTIILPNKVSDLNNIKIWGHGDSSAEIQKLSEDTVYFYDDELESGVMLEVRMLILENGIFSNITRNYNEEKLDEIISEENSVINYNYIIIIAVVSGLIIVCSVFYSKINPEKNTKKYVKKEVNLKINPNPNNQYTIYDKIPREESTSPLQIGILYFYDIKTNKCNANKHIPEIFSAMILDFVDKGFIENKIIDNKTYFELCNISKIMLNTEQKKIYEVFQEISKNKFNEKQMNLLKENPNYIVDSTKFFTIDDLKYYFKNYTADFEVTFNAWVNETMESLNFVMEEDEYYKIQGLKRYIEKELNNKNDLSSKYLICATIFGINKSIIENSVKFSTKKDTIFTDNGEVIRKRNFVDLYSYILHEYTIWHTMGYIKMKNENISFGKSKDTFGTANPGGSGNGGSFIGRWSAEAGGGRLYGRKIRVKFYRKV